MDECKQLTSSIDLYGNFNLGIDIVDFQDGQNEDFIMAVNYLVDIFIKYLFIDILSFLWNSHINLP